MDSVLRFAWLQGGILSLAISSTLLAVPTQAQNISSAGDGTGTTVQYNAASQTYTINGGTQIDANLFHSFQQFGLSTGEIANFLANPNVANVLARDVSDPDEIRGLLVEQVTHSVRWRESVAWMAEQGVTETWEIGAGKALTGMVRRIAKDVATRAVGTPEDVAAAVAG